MSEQPEPSAPPGISRQTGGAPWRRRQGLLIAFGVVAVLAVAAIGLVIGHFVWTRPTTTVVTRVPPAFGVPGPYRITPTIPVPSPGQGSSAAGAPSNAAAIAKATDPALVDIDTTLSYEGAEGAGTGIVVSSSGEVLTNDHVIEGATSISVTDVGNGKTYAATVVGYDRSKDIAVLRLTSASGLQTAKLGDSATVKVGDGVVAVGNAEGLGGTPSYAAGSVLALDQSITAEDAANGGSEQLSGLIDTNAGIQSGDSGGALVNSSGEVIGVLTAGSEAFRFEQPSTQGFAIPINQALSVAGQIEAARASATVHIGATAFLGIDVQPPPSGTGAEIIEVIANQPAAAAGLTAGDTITAFNGKTISSPETLTDLILNEKPGTTVKLTYLDLTGASHTVPVTLASGPPQ